MPDLGPALREALRRDRGDAGGERVDLIETHISWVVLAGDFAWKVKKPVRLEFADFSTLDRRRRFCHEELRLNRRLAPDLYLDVVPISGSEAEPVLEGSGAPIDYAVKMRRFPQDHLLTAVVERRELAPRHVDGLADRVARFHAEIEVAGTDSQFGHPESVWQPVVDNFEWLNRHVHDPSRRELLARVRERTQDGWPRLSKVCAHRLKGGFVRECHGDMHLGNMVLLDDRVTMFDAIDFNPGLRWVDVMSEAAFVVMDLKRRGRSDLAHRFLNRYCERTHDYAGLRLLPFYLAYRALVRAKVNAIRFDQSSVCAHADHPDDGEQRDFDRLIQLAAAAVAGRRPWLAITHGLSGSGKSTVAQALVEQGGAIAIRSDVERKRMHAEGALDGEPYSEESKNRTYQSLGRIAGEVLAAGLPVVVDATFLNRNHRRGFRTIAESYDSPFTILDCTAPMNVLQSRVEQRGRRGRDASDADLSVLETQRTERAPLSNDEREQTLLIDTSSEKHNALDGIVRRLRQSRRNLQAPSA